MSSELIRSRSKCVTIHCPDSAGTVPVTIMVVPVTGAAAFAGITMDHLSMSIEGCFLQQKGVLVQQNITRRQGYYLFFLAKKGTTTEESCYV